MCAESLRNLVTTSCLLGNLHDLVHKACNYFKGPGAWPVHFFSRSQTLTLHQARETMEGA